MGNDWNFTFCPRSPCVAAANTAVACHDDAFLSVPSNCIEYVDLSSEAPYCMSLSPVRVGARSGLGPIWALMFFVKNVTFRVQTAPFDKITIDFWRSRRRLYIPDLLKAKNSNVRLSFFKGVVFSSKMQTVT